MKTPEQLIQAAISDLKARRSTEPGLGIIIAKLNMALDRMKPQVSENVEISRYAFVSKINGTSETGIADMFEPKVICFCKEDVSKLLLPLLNNSALSRSQNEVHGSDAVEMPTDERLKLIQQIAENAPELNMGNYNEDQVRSINNALIEICQILK